MRGATGMPVTDRGAKQPRDIGRVRRTGLVQIVVEVIAGAVEEQADMQGLATRRRNPVTGRQAQSILIAPFLLALARIFCCTCSTRRGKRPSSGNGGGSQTRHVSLRTRLRLRASERGFDRVFGAAEAVAGRRDLELIARQKERTVRPDFLAGVVGTGTTLLSSCF